MNISIVRKRLVLAGSMLVTVVVHSGLNQVVAGEEPVNLARGKSYTFSVAPDYGLCTDEGDATDLTDGKQITAKDACFWCDKGCVGWGNTSKGISITIDLGAVTPISGAAYHTAAGTSDVMWPTAIEMLVSDDGATFYHAGELLRLSDGPLPPAYHTYDVRMIRTTAMRTFGRYVRFQLPPQVSYVFVDELEVYGGDGALLKVDRGEPITMASLQDPLHLTRQGVYLRVRRDIETIDQMARQLRGDARSTAIAALVKLREELDGAAHPAAYDGFRAVLPLDDLHARVWAVRGELLSRTMGAPLRVWHHPPYEQLSPFAKPGKTLRSLKLPMMRGERRAEVLNLTNCTDAPRTVRLSMADLSAGAGFEAQQVGFVDTLNGHAIALSLTAPARDGDGYVVTVPAGMTQQVWLAFSPGDISPGDHRGRIVLTSGDWSHHVDMTLSIAPMVFPASTDFHLGMWDYIFDESYGIDPSNKQAVRAHVMSDPLLNVLWCTVNSVPMPRGSDAEGNLTGTINFSRWDAYVKFWPGKKHYFAFALQFPHSDFAGQKRGTAAFDRAVSQWAAQWAAHNREVLGLKPKQAGVLLIDEPAGEEWFKATYDFSRAFKQGTDEILVFNDPAAQDLHSEFGNELIDVSDIVCVDPTYFERATDEVKKRLVNLGDEGKSLWFYRCFGPVRSFDLSYHRVQPWHAAAYGGNGEGFWAYHSPQGINTWNEYACNGWKIFTPLLIDETSVTPTKQYEAMREGIMDWQYFRMLEQRVEALEASGSRSGKVKTARQLLDALPKQLLTELWEDYGEVYYYQWGDQCSRAEAARREVLAALTRLHDVK